MTPVAFDAIRTLVVVTLVAGTVGCSSFLSSDRRAVLFPKATLEKTDVSVAIKFEEELSHRSEQAPPEGTPWFEVLPGAAPIIISAPHATTPTREDGTHQFSEPGTGSLAVALHRLTGATAIYTTYKSPSDPNFYDDNAYKQALAELVASKKPILVIDLHVSHWYRPYDIDFGTMGGKSLLGKGSLLRELAEQLRRAGLINLSQDFYPASKNATVTKWVAARGVPCIQLEISSTWTSANASQLNAHRFAQLLEALTRFVRSVAPDPGA